MSSGTSPVTLDSVAVAIYSFCAPYPFGHHNSGWWTVRLATVCTVHPDRHAVPGSGATATITDGDGPLGCPAPHPVSATHVIDHVNCTGEEAAGPKRTGMRNATDATDSEAVCPGGNTGMAEARSPSSVAVPPPAEYRSSTDFQIPRLKAGVPKSTPPPLPTPAFHALKWSRWYPPTVYVVFAPPESGLVVKSAFK